MRVIAARPAIWRGDPFTKLRFVSLATIGLALLDPVVALTALSQTEVNCDSVGINAAGFANDCGRWLMASSLADLAKAESLFEAALASLDGIDEPDLLFRSIVNTAKPLATPPDRRTAFQQKRLLYRFVAAGESAWANDAAGRAPSQITDHLLKPTQLTWSWSPVNSARSFSKIAEANRGLDKVAVATGSSLERTRSPSWPQPQESAMMINDPPKGCSRMRRVVLVAVRAGHSHIHQDDFGPEPVGRPGPPPTPS